MDVRDAIEADADRLAELTGSPRDVMRNLVHDRTVRVVDAEADGGNATGGGADEGDGGGDGDAAGETATGDADAAEEIDDADGGTDDADGQPIRGFVSYDAREDTVHVTQLEGDGGACDRLLEEPIHFAEREDMDVQLLVPEDETGTRDAAENAGFERAGSGPMFEGQETVRYRLDPKQAG